MDEEKEKEILDKVRELYDEGIEGNEPKYARIRRALGFKRGNEGHWKEETLAEFRSSSRPAVTLNMVSPKVEFLLGTFTTNRKDLNVYNRTAISTAVAGVLTDLMEDADDNSHVIYEEVDQFEDGLLVEGWMQVGLEKDKEEHLKFVIRRRDPLEVVTDPDGKHVDINVDSKYICTQEWIAKEKIEAEYPDKAEELKTSGSQKGMLRRAAETFVTWIRGGTLTNDRDQRVEKHRYLKITCWWKDYEPQTIWTDSGDAESGIETNEMFLTDKDDIKKARMSARLMPDRFTVSRNGAGEKLNKTTWINDVLLDHDEDPWGNNGITTKFPLTRFSCFFKDGYSQGIIDSVIGDGETVIGAQELVNKSLSQALDHMGRSVRSATYYWSDTFDAETEDEKDFREHGPRPGGIFKLRAGAKKPEPGEQAELSRSSLDLVALGSESIKQTMGVNDQNLGYEPRRQMSGKAMQIQDIKGLTVNARHFDRFDCSRRLRGELEIELILTTDVYSEEEIKTIIQPERLTDPQLLEEAAKEIGPPPEPPPEPPLAMLKIITPKEQATVMGDYEEAVGVYQQRLKQYDDALKQRAEEILFEQLREMRTGRFLVKCAENQNTVTRREERRLELYQFNESYPGVIPPDVMVKATDLPEKDKILEHIKQMKAQARQMPNELVGGSAPPGNM